MTAGAAELVRLWMRKVELVGERAFDADGDLQLGTLVRSSSWEGIGC